MNDHSFYLEWQDEPNDDGKRRAIAHFVERFQAQPAKIIEKWGGWLVGPVPERETDAQPNG
jgi:hypothetical protein